MLMSWRKHSWAGAPANKVHDQSKSTDLGFSEESTAGQAHQPTGSMILRLLRPISTSSHRLRPPLLSWSYLVNSSSNFWGMKRPSESKMCVSLPCLQASERLSAGGLVHETSLSSSHSGAAEATGIPCAMNVLGVDGESGVWDPAVQTPVGEGAVDHKDGNEG